MAANDNFNGKERLVLNPAYILRQDGTRALIVSENEVKYDVGDWFSFIHPVHAQILSFFKGVKTFEEELDECVDCLSIPKRSILQLVKPLICNEHWVRYVSKSGQETFFPSMVLVKNNGTLKRRKNHSFSEFKIYKSPDFVTDRLAYPVKVMLELTMRCYVNCEYCYAKRKEAMLKTMCSAEIVSLIHQLHQDGAIQIDINGGEVLLYPGIEDVLFELSRLGYEPLISTKMPLDIIMIDYVKSLPGVQLQVSLDSDDEEILRKMINAPKGYLYHMKRSLEYMSASGMGIKVNCVITKYNCSISKLESFVSWLSQFSCVKGLSLTICGFSLYKSNYESLRLTVDDVRLIEERLDALRILSPFPITLGGYDKMSMYSSLKSWSSYERRALCTGNIRNIVILPNGDVTVCEELYDHPAFVLGNVRDNTLMEIWNGEKANKLYDKANICSSETPCSSCNVMAECRNGKGVCWKTTLMAYGEEKWNYPDPRCPKSPVPSRDFCINDL